MAQAVRDRASTLLTDDPTRAASLARALVDGARAAGASSATLAVAYRARAEASLYTGELHLARRDYARAARAAEASGREELLGQILVGWIGLLAVLGERTASSRLVERARRILERTRDDAYLAKLYMNLGTLAFSEERYRDALDAYGRAAEMFDRLGVRDGTWASLLMNQALAATNLSRVDEARALFLTVEEASVELGLDRVRAQATFNRAHLERLLGDYRSALSLLADSSARFRAQGIRDMTAATERERAEIYLELSMPRDALDRARDAAASFAALDMDLDAHLARLVAGEALLLLERTDDAIELLHEVERWFHTHRIWPRRAATALMIARAHLARGDLDRARPLVQRALTTFRSHGMARQESQACRLLAEAYVVRGRMGAAKRLLESARRAATSSPPGDLAELASLEGRLAWARGRPKEARRQLLRAARYVEAQHELIPGVELRARAFENHARIYRELLRVSIGTPGVSLDALLELVETSRARGFRERTASRRPHAQARIRGARGRLGALTAREEELLYGRPGSARDRALLALRKEQRHLEHRLLEELRNADASAGTHGSHALPSADHIAGRLARDTALVEYVVVDERVLVFVLAGGRADMHVIEGAAPRIRTAVEVFRLQLDTLVATSARPIANMSFLRRATERALRSLYDVLLEPIVKRLEGARRLVVVPTGELHHVPFECLHDGTQYVDERWIIGRRPAAGLRGRQRRRRPSERGAFLTGTLRNGPQAVREEIEEIARALPAARREVVWDAPTERLLGALTHCSLVHISAHGVFRDDNPWFSRISTGDGALFMADLMDRRVTADLVVLSACGTGQVFAGSGDDLSGVAHAFLMAGARRLVASHWRVHDRATRELMGLFYQQLSATDMRDTAAALSVARRSLRERWDHPFYWGSFGLHGV